MLYTFRETSLLQEQSKYKKGGFYVKHGTNSKGSPMGAHHGERRGTYHNDRLQCGDHREDGGVHMRITSGLTDHPEEFLLFMPLSAWPEKY